MPENDSNRFELMQIRAQVAALHASMKQMRMQLSAITDLVDRLDPPPESDPYARPQSAEFWRKETAAW